MIRLTRKQIEALDDGLLRAQWHGLTRGEASCQALDELEDKVVGWLLHYRVKDVSNSAFVMKATINTNGTFLEQKSIVQLMSYAKPSADDKLFILQRTVLYGS